MAPTVAGWFTPPGADDDLHGRGDARAEVAGDDLIAEAALRVVAEQVHPERAGPERQCRPGEQGDSGQPDDEEAHRPAHDGMGPGCPEAASMRSGDETTEPAGPLDPVAEDHEHRRHQRQRRGHRDQGDEDAADADRDDRRLAGGEQRQQPDRDREAGERDRLARVTDGFHDRLLDRPPGPPLGPEAGQQEERIVDPEAEAQHRREVLEEHREVDRLADDERQGEGDDDRDEAHDQRQTRRHERPEHEHEDDRRDRQADGLGGRDAFLARGCEIGVDRLGPSDVCPEPRGRGAGGHGVDDPPRGVHSVRVGRGAQVEEHVRRPAVGADERAVAARVVAVDARHEPRRLGGAHDGLGRVPIGRVVDGQRVARDDELLLERAAVGELGRDDVGGRLRVPGVAGDELTVEHLLQARSEGDPEGENGDPGGEDGPPATHGQAAESGEEAVHGGASR